MTRATMRTTAKVLKIPLEVVDRIIDVTCCGRVLLPREVSTHLDFRFLLSILHSDKSLHTVAMSLNCVYSLTISQECRTSLAARKVLEAKGISHYWDMVIRADEMLDISA